MESRPLETNVPIWSCAQNPKTHEESRLLSDLDGGAIDSQHLGQFRIELLQLLRVLVLPDLEVVIDGPQRVEQSVLALCQLVVMEVGVGELELPQVGAAIVQRDTHAQQLPLQDSGRGEPEATNVAGVGGANGVKEGVEKADSICLSESLATAKGEDAHVKILGGLLSDLAIDMKESIVIMHDLCADENLRRITLAKEGGPISIFSRYVGINMTCHDIIQVKDRILTRADLSRIVTIVVLIGVVPIVALAGIAILAFTSIVTIMAFGSIIAIVALTDITYITGIAAIRAPLNLAAGRFITLVVSSGILRRDMT
ncbi:hypothetical protein PG993_008047 [Apiospora rasikravindrae]|uniref:Uncharacterized protein n=1 Tax=Apiospora rasikravindrae TaxID=990691 RepID=A0ABR1T0M2_9PEZI